MFLIVNFPFSIFPSILICPTRFVLVELRRVGLDFGHSVAYPAQSDPTELLEVAGYFVVANFAVTDLTAEYSVVVEGFVNFAGAVVVAAGEFVLKK